jgi:hypothetical protein
MNLAREKFLCPLDLDWNMKELERGILKEEKGRREDYRGKISLLMGIREVKTWRNRNQMDFCTPDIVAVAGGTVTGLYRFEKDVRRIGNVKTYHCDPSAVRLNYTP